MAFERIEITASDIEATKAYKSANEVLKVRCITAMYVKAFSGYLTVCKHKGIDYMLNVYHMNDFKKALLRELWEKQNLTKLQL